MAEMIYGDIAIIGAGAAGLSLAASASRLGAKVILIESGKMGGDCLNYGCIPSKALLSAAKACQAARQAAELGIYAANIRVDFPQVMQHVKQVVENLSLNDSIERFEKLGVTVIQTSAKFLNSNTIEAGKFHVKAKRFVIASGSLPFVPLIAGLDTVKYFTNESIFDLTQLPPQLIVIGGGPIGCELAQAFAMLGSQVTIIENNNILPKDEPEAGEIIREQFTQKNTITLHENTQIKFVSQDTKGIKIICEKNNELLILTGSHLLIAAGRRANLTSLALEKAGIKFANNIIILDKYLKTCNKKIYAMGDVTGNYQFTHIANYHASIVLKNILFRIPAKVNYSAIPWVTYTEPEIAHAGITTADAKRNNIAYHILDTSYDENDRARTENIRQGKIKIILNKKKQVIGATIIGHNAGELILPWIMVIQEKKKLSCFTDLTIPYPTLSEMHKQLAGKFYAPLLFSSKVRAIVRFLLKLG